MRQPSSISKYSVELNLEEQQIIDLLQNHLHDEFYFFKAKRKQDIICGKFNEKIGYFFYSNRVWFNLFKPIFYARIGTRGAVTVFSGYIGLFWLTDIIIFILFFCILYLIPSFEWGIGFVVFGLIFCVWAYKKSQLERRYLIEFLEKIFKGHMRRKVIRYSVGIKGVDVVTDYRRYGR